MQAVICRCKQPGCALKRDKRACLLAAAVGRVTMSSAGWVYGKGHLVQLQSIPDLPVLDQAYNDRQLAMLLLRNDRAK